MTLLLVRHGRVAHSAGWKWLDRQGIAAWRDGYDRAGITDDAPPQPLVAEVANAAIVAASDLPRAVQSAMRLAPEREIKVVSLFREIPLPIPTWAIGKAPLAAWAMAIHAQWLVDIARGRAEPAEVLERAQAAGRWCLEACTPADGSGSVHVTVVTHGVFRRLLARRLRAEGWRSAPGPQSFAHWSVWRFEPPRSRSSSLTG